MKIDLLTVDFAPEIVVSSPGHHVPSAPLDGSEVVISLSPP